ncbi:hypothetical protein [Bernardetia sp. MNP-M8]|uniref:hypothetical protein n=1 Tax=Bernardetia sp. MNP-M8 TaxID=3127470 RepID=UPI0030D41DFE
MNTDYRLEYEIFESQNENRENKTKPQIWFAFHGIGQNTEAFKNFAIQNNLKIYSFGLFYHEKNQNNVEKLSDKERKTTLKNWLVLMQQFLEEEKINLDYSITIIGFSLGVRPALQFVSNFSKSVSIHQIILIAPETLAISNWYRFGTQTLFGNALLKKVVSSKVFKEIIISTSSFIFPKKAQKLIRYQVYHGINSLTSAWLAYRSFEIYEKQWKEIYENYEGKITIVASEKDAFVNLNIIRKFVRKNSTDKGKSIKWILSKSPHAHLLREFRL